MEEQIWKAADKLRGSDEHSEYKNVVLSLIFKKYANDTIEFRTSAVSAYMIEPLYGLQNATEKSINDLTGSN